MLTRSKRRLLKSYRVLSYMADPAKNREVLHIARIDPEQLKSLKLALDMLETYSKCYKEEYELKKIKITVTN